MSFDGYEYEDYLLRQWGIWSSSGKGYPTCRTNWVMIDRDYDDDREVCEISEDMIDAIERGVRQLEFHEVRLLKRYYIHVAPDCNMQFVQDAVKRFASFYESPRRRIA